MIELEEENELPSWCYTCGNEGLYNKECPECLRPQNGMGLTRLSTKTLRDVEKQFDRILVPEAYKGNPWDEEVFWTLNPQFLVSPDGGPPRRLSELSKFTNRLSGIHRYFQELGVPKVSVMIVAPCEMSKTVWAYSCMQHAVIKGFKVAPLFDTLEVAEMMGASLKNPNYRLYGEITFGEYVDMDVVFMSVTKTEYRKDAHGVIRELLDKRSRRNKPTFILSEYGIDEIGSWDYSGSFNRFIRSENGYNKLKVPALEEFSIPKFLNGRWHKND